MTLTDTDSLRPGDVLSGFRLEKTSYVASREIRFYEFEHLKTGARYVHLANDDDNNVFAVALRTTPRDSTGVAHILEHVALAGSKKYPVRDPFFSMLNRSLKTFMNAFTSSDWTMYPYATRNPKDFYNLMGVYLDAVFFPLITKQSFMQEGIRLEFEADETGQEKPTYKGVVFNEMKGAMSTQDDRMHQGMTEALFPTITYGNNSGGDPLRIPDLAWEDLKAFHRRHYHPSNAWFYSYGSFPFAEHLAFVEARALDFFDRIDPDTQVPAEKRYDAPRSFVFPYPVDENDQDERNRQIALGWLTCAITEESERLSLEILEDVLLGNSASPLRKALLESELGKSLSPVSGYESGCRESYFCVGLQGVRREDVKRVEALIPATLERIEKEGIQTELVESAVHQLELSMKEISGNHYPYGLGLLLRHFDAWMHGGNFERGLDFDRLIAEIKSKMTGKRHFEGLIRKHLLNNPHRVSVLLEPDPNFNGKFEKAIAEKLEKTEKELDEKAKATIRKECEELVQSRLSKEDLTVLPKLKITDIPPKFSEHPPSSFEGSKRYFYELPTNGILYLNLWTSLPGFDEDVQKRLPFVLGLLTSAGNREMGYDEQALLISKNTGGVGFSGDAYAETENGRIRETLRITGKALADKIPRLFSILKILTEKWSLEDFERIKRLVREAAVASKNSILRAGNAYAATLAKRRYGKLLSMDESEGGVTQVRYLQRLASMNEEELRRTVESWAETLRQIFRSEYAGIALCGTADCLKKAEKEWQGLADLFPARNEARQPRFNLRKSGVALRETWVTATPVSYVARTYPVAAFPHEDSPALTALAALLESKFVHREVRETGGAYGGNVSYDSEEGMFTFLSYRDPNLRQTWDVYERAVQWAVEGRFNAEDVEEALLKVFSRLDKPLSPAGRASQDLSRRLKGVTPEMLNAYRRKLLAVRKDDLVEIAKKRLQGEHSDVAVTSPEILAKDKDRLENYETFDVFSG